MEETSGHSRKTSNVLSAEQQWKQSTVGWMKVNVNAALFIETGSTGLGSVARDTSGRFLKARSLCYEGLRVPREAEALGLKEELSWARDSNYKRCIFETNSQTLAMACKGRRGRSYFDTLVMDYIALFEHVDEVLVVFVRRSANITAHLLARAANSMSGSRDWHEHAPDFIRHVIASDLY